MTQPTHLLIDIPGISPREQDSIQDRAERWLIHGGVLVLSGSRDRYAKVTTIPAEAIGGVTVRADERSDTHYTFHKLRVVATRNPIVKAALTTWESGGFESLEQCLIALALHLTEQNEQLSKNVVDAMQSQPVKTWVRPKPLVPIDPITIEGPFIAAG